MLQLHVCRFRHHDQTFTCERAIPEYEQLRDGPPTKEWRIIALFVAVESDIGWFAQGNSERFPEIAPSVGPALDLQYQYASGLALHLCRPPASTDHPIVSLHNNLQYFNKYLFI